MSTRKPKAEPAATPHENAAELAPEQLAEPAPADVTEGNEPVDSPAEVTPPADVAEPTHYLVAATKRRGSCRGRPGKRPCRNHEQRRKQQIERARAQKQLVSQAA